MDRKSAKQIGALWRHQKEGVGSFLSGTLDMGALGSVPIVIFQNQRKEEGSNQPDYRIMLSRRENDEEEAPEEEQEVVTEPAPPQERSQGRTRQSGSRGERR